MTRILGGLGLYSFFSIAGFGVVLLASAM